MLLAHLDPTTGTLGTQVLIAVLIGAAIVLRRWPLKLWRRWRSARDKSQSVAGEGSMPAETSKRWKLLRTALLCQVWAMLCFAPVLGMATVAGNRYFLHWDAAAAGIRCFVVTMTGVVLWLLSLPLAKLPAKWQQSITTVGMIFVLASVVWPLVIDTNNYRAELPIAFWVGAALSLILAETRLSLSQVQRLMSGGSLTLAPLIVIYWVCAFMYPVHPSSLGNAKVEVASSADSPALPRSTQRENVYIVVVDDWPLRVGCNRQGVPREIIPNLHALANGATVFGDAHSPSCYKASSLPRLLYQTNQPLALRGSRTGFGDEDFAATQETANLFTQARSAGYRTCMLGWLHPYRTLLGDSVDYVHSRCIYRWYGDSWAGQCRAFATDAVFRFLGSDPSDLVLRNRKQLHVDHLDQIRKDLLERAEEVIADPEPGMFAVFHLPSTPNAARFALYGPEAEASKRTESSVNTREEVVQLDRMIGRLVKALQRSGKYENCTLIVTSDRGHAPEEEDLQRASHVPLLVKFPGQQKQRLIEEPFSTNCLAALLDFPAWLEQPGIESIAADNSVAAERAVDRLVMRVRQEDLYEDLPRIELRRHRLLVR